MSIHALMGNLDKLWNKNDWYLGLEKSWKSLEMLKVMEDRHSDPAWNVIFPVIYCHTCYGFACWRFEHKTIMKILYLIIEKSWNFKVLKHKFSWQSIHNTLYLLLTFSDSFIWCEQAWMWSPRSQGWRSRWQYTQRSAKG